MEDGVYCETDQGTLQSGVLSPVLANVHLHYALDTWFETEDETSVTFEGSGVDDDGEVVECRWISPDGQIRTYLGSSSSVTLEDALEGMYRFAVNDDDGAWSEEEKLNLFYTRDGGGDLLPIIVLLAIAAIIAMGFICTFKKERYRQKRIRMGARNSARFQRLPIPMAPQSPWTMWVQVNHHPQ